MKQCLKCLICKKSINDPETGYFCPIHEAGQTDCKYYEKENNKMKVFLGGTCEGRDWRNELIPKLKCDYFNPVVEEWTEEVKNMVKRNGAKVFESLEQVAYHLNASNL